MPPPQPRPADRRITGILLAGGQAAAWAVDKGLAELAGRLMAAHAPSARPPVDAPLINANQNLPVWRPCHPVFGDDIGGLPARLAGLHAGALRAQHPSSSPRPATPPFLPADLVERPAAALHAADAQLAVAKTFGQPHPVCSAAGAISPITRCLPRRRRTQDRPAGNVAA